MTISHCHILLLLYVDDMIITLMTRLLYVLMLMQLVILNYN